MAKGTVMVRVVRVRASGVLSNQGSLEARCGFPLLLGYETFHLRFIQMRLGFRSEVFHLPASSPP